MSWRRFAALATASLLAGCSIFGGDEEQEPSPLVDFDASLGVRESWSVQVGKGSEVPYPGLRPAYDSGRVFAAAPDGQVRALDPESGRTQWSTDLELELGAGPGVGDDLAVVGTVDGEVIALDQATGAVRWRARVSSEVLAAPAVGRDKVVVRALDGRVFGLDAASGARQWVFDTSVPLLTLRGNSPPLINAGIAYVGFDSGEVVALRVEDGSVLWQQSISKPEGRTELERIVDIDGRFEILGGDLYVVTYQGLLSSVTGDSGRLLWVKDMSSYAGLAAGQRQLNVSDADDSVWGLDRLSGGTLWKQDRLLRRAITAPARHGDYVVVGDFEGYLHWLSEEDGRFVARERVDGSALVAAPVAIGDSLFVQSADARLTAFRLPRG